MESPCHHHHYSTVHLSSDKWFGFNLEKGSKLFTRCENYTNSVVFISLLICCIFGGSISQYLHDSASRPEEWPDLKFILDNFRMIMFFLCLYRILLLGMIYQAYIGAINHDRKKLRPYLFAELPNFLLNGYFLYFLMLYGAVIIDLPVNGIVLVLSYLAIYTWNLYGYSRIYYFYAWNDEENQTGLTNVEAEAVIPIYPTVPINTTHVISYPHNSETSAPPYPTENSPQKYGFIDKN